MKEIELKDEDYNAIASKAVQDYVRHAIKPKRDFIAECYIKAAIEYFNYKGYTIQNGKIFKNEDNKRT